MLGRGLFIARCIPSTGSKFNVPPDPASRQQRQQYLPSIALDSVECEYAGLLWLRNGEVQRIWSGSCAFQASGNGTWSGGESDGGTCGHEPGPTWWRQIEVC